MSRFSQPLQGKGLRRAQRIRPAFYRCLIGVAISQFFYPHVRPDYVNPTSGPSFGPDVIESRDCGEIAVYRHKEDGASDAFSFRFGRRSGLDGVSIAKLEQRARKSIERGAGRTFGDHDWIQMKGKLAEFGAILQDWEKQTKNHSQASEST
jgi:hypothetical protein